MGDFRSQPDGAALRQDVRAWECTDQRYPVVCGIVTTSQETVDAWKEGGLKFVPLVRAQPQGADTREAVIEECAEIADRFNDCGGDFIAQKIRDLALSRSSTETPRVPKVRTSHHRNKEEAERLQALVAKRYVSDTGAKE